MQLLLRNKLQENVTLLLDFKVSDCFGFFFPFFSRAVDWSLLEQPAAMTYWNIWELLKHSKPSSMFLYYLPLSILKKSFRSVDWHTEQCCKKDGAHTFCASQDSPRSSQRLRSVPNKFKGIFVWFINTREKRS